ncbi:hypothetical protein HMPREF1988_02067, partial [Porphyromonas gingivalis F0185]
QVVPEILKTRAKKISFWFENFFVPEPKRKNSQTTFCGAILGKIYERKSVQDEYAPPLSLILYRRW